MFFSRQQDNPKESAVFVAPSAEIRKAQVLRIVAKAKRCHLKIGTAESLTGGGIFSTLISEPGSGPVMDAGIVTYTNEAKIRHLGVTDHFIQQYSPVSSEVALEMALHQLEQSEENLVVSATGFAGPCPPDVTPLKPPGTLFIGIAFRPTTKATPTVYIYQCQMSGINRTADIAQATQSALDALEDKLDTHIMTLPKHEVSAIQYEGLLVKRHSLVAQHSAA